MSSDWLFTKFGRFLLIIITTSCIIRSLITPPLPQVRDTNLGKVRSQGKVYNSANDLLLWFNQDEDRFYDTDSEVG